MSIQVKEVSKFYGKQKALDSLSFEISDAEVVGFLGPNGAGKSTMMKIITGFLPQSSGDVFVNGLNVMEHSLEIRKQIGYLPEHNPLYLDLYVKEYLEYVAGIYKLGKKKKQRVNEMIELTGLGLEQKKKIGALSKGYRQRVGLAQALIHDPKVLILDEPTTGLDPNQLIEVRQLIQDIGKEKTVMLSTHIMQEVEAICERVLIINKGRLVADQASNNIHSIKESHMLDLQFTSAVPQAFFQSITGITHVEALANHRYQVSAKTDVREQIFQMAVSNNLVLIEMKSQERSLETLFQELTRQ
ncbi:gliding motility-associated ABC transporter ATP-binding subunit GldA [Ancylomarina euxinus]|uniref:Gliding motility-associated ABC transporter ATP-binding subunit GldA n=1 Tax=Ancylomarina euxinus TaxID=2283627 RepID=A0A425XZI6_9BACT|nr:gliding motility-associated ABC transporter ATP-binding subunit GldA [Ancylomarina euxinus]MCZ4695518.1 gliding motility-associated ABC transporter ATP-binding subunit GldA [Ancylomarina euxinus]MUP15664.1 gliding motility-associated ABC transporter ATP-binding subunit GldA [Ancylomarina euxinus]RRG20657.1 gliding motility-associated ABC transporter ATP-binding subunit GldA [Ancylomarina euxinus]